MGFSKFNLPPPLIKAITSLGYAEPTPVQAQVIPEAMQGRDVRACAQTGTGKTCAFVVPIIDKLLKHPLTHGPSVLIVAPTRELATQVFTVFQNLARHTSLKSALVVGGSNATKQVRQIRAGAQVLVATPGRLLDHVTRGVVTLKNVHTFVLDEADRMLDIGFLPDIRRMMAMLPQRHQTLLFSATFPPAIQQLVKQFLQNPHYVDLAPSLPAQNVTQLVYPVRADQKGALLQAILEVSNIFSALIFCRTKRGASKLGQTLAGLGKSVAVIHSDKSQSQRAAALQGFKDLKFQILVATDVAARGIDVKNISHVINYNVPENPEDYVHRIGRTGRANATGDAFTLVSPEEERYLKQIEQLIRKPIPRGVIPDFPYSSAPHLMTKQGPQHHSHGPRHQSSRHQQPGRQHQHHGQGQQHPAQHSHHPSGISAHIPSQGARHPDQHRHPQTPPQGPKPHHPNPHPQHPQHGHPGRRHHGGQFGRPGHRRSGGYR